MKKHSDTLPISYDEMMLKVSNLAQSSNTYKKFGTYIEKHYMDLGFMSAEEVALAVGISQGSVSRFCKDLGFLGYSDFVKSLHNIFRDHITAPERVKRNASPKDDTKKKILDQECNNLRELMSVTASSEYQKLVKFLQKTPNIHLMSSRYTATILPYAHYILSKMRDNVYTVVPGSIEWQNLHLKNPKENGVLVFTFPRYSNELIEMVKQVHTHGIKYHLITDSHMCPLYPEAENRILLPLNNSSIYDNYGTPITFINLLMNDVAKGLPGIDTRISQMEAYEKENHIYYDYH